MKLPHFAVALILGALPGVVSFDSVLGYPLHHRYHHAPSRGPQDPYYLATQRRPQKTPPPPPLPRVLHPPPALRASRAHGLRMTRPPPGDCPAGAPGANVTDSGAPCLRWADVPPFLALSPPAGWAQLRGQRHNFCRSPDGAGRPWCFYGDARGKVDWGYCDCRRGEWPRSGGDRGPAGSPPGWASALGAPGGESESGWGCGFASLCVKVDGHGLTVQVPWHRDCELARRALCAVTWGDSLNGGWCTLGAPG